MTDVKKKYLETRRIFKKLGAVLDVDSEASSDLNPSILSPFSWWRLITDDNEVFFIRITQTSGDYRIQYVNAAGDRYTEFDYLMKVLNTKQKEIALYNLDLFV